MRFLCFRLCSKSKTPAVHEPTLPEEKSTVIEKSNSRDGSKRDTQTERKISVDQYSHVFTDEYAISSASDCALGSKRDC